VNQTHSSPTPPRVVSKRAYTEAEAAAYLGVSRSFLRQDRMNGHRDGRLQGPPWVRLGRRSIRYLHEDLDAWLDAFKNSPQAYDHEAG
jgi:predicted DNA-binding transcriptional regulator AlpA